MKTLIIGSNSQLGWELQRTCPDHMTFTSCDFPKIDFLSPDSITACIKTIQPDCVINAAAYTAVDKAEQEKTIADRLNHLAVRELAQLCKTHGIFLVQISTDFIFNGKNYRPYRPDDLPDPISVYGESKLKGELAVREILGKDAAVIRTAWLYSSHGANFVKSMINLMNDSPELKIIDEQIGTPTWANGLAMAVWSAIEKKLTGIHHYTDAGVASWYDFAVAIQEEGMALGLIQKEIPIQPIAAENYPAPAKRPFYSVLDKRSLWQSLDILSVHWRRQLRSMLKEMK